MVFERDEVELFFVITVTEKIAIRMHHKWMTGCSVVRTMTGCSVVATMMGCSVVCYIVVVVDFGVD